MIALYKILFFVNVIVCLCKVAFGKSAICFNVFILNLDWVQIHPIEMVLVLFGFQYDFRLLYNKAHIHKEWIDKFFHNFLIPAE